MTPICTCQSKLEICCEHTWSYFDQGFDLLEGFYDDGMRFGKDYMLPFAECYGVRVHIKSLANDKLLYSVHERRKDDTQNLQMITHLAAGDSFNRVVRIVRDLYRGTRQYVDVFNALVSRVRVPCPSPKHSIESDKITLKRIRLLAVLLNPSEADTAFKLWDLRILQDTFCQIALVDARFILTDQKCYSCKLVEEFALRVAPDLIPDF